MEKAANSTTQRIFSPLGCLIQAILGLIAVSVLAAVTVDGLGMPYWARTALACVCFSVIGILLGYMSGALDRGYLIRTFIIGFITALQASAYLYRPLPGRGLGIILKPHSLIAFVLLYTTMIIAYLASYALFRRIHPDEAVIPAEGADEPG
jgi:hypothetical protein